VFRKFHKAKKIELSCPYCSHRQLEPPLVISSFCGKCGEHFRVSKGIAIPSPALRVSGIAEVVKEDKGPSSPGKQPSRAESSDESREQTPEDAWLVNAEESATGARPLPRHEETEDSSDSGISAGAFFGLVDEEAIAEEEAGEKELGRKAQSKEVLAEGSMAALIEAQVAASPPEKDKMPPNFVPPEKRKKLIETSNDFEVRCFRCYHIQQVSKFAKSTQCERCSVYIGLANYEIKTNKQHTLRTRGDIVIARKGGLRKCEIACHNLMVNGHIDAFVDCSGEAVFRSSGIVRGNLYCRKLIVEKNAVVEFPDGVKTAKADIFGRVVGDITCSGTVRISKNGSVEGNVTSVDLQMKEGATISGEKTLDPDISTELPVKMGFNPTIIG
jgi:cytoskeletal protein CcmA (bactofilin family)